MASLVESFIFKMVVDNQQFLRGMNQSTQAVQQAGTAMAKSQGLLQQTSSAFFGVAITKSLLDFAKGASAAQAALVNVKSTADQVFGPAANDIEEWAKGSVEAVGLSERAAIQAASTIAALGKAAGLTGNDLAGFSKEMVKYATDLSQMYNTSVEDAIAAIQSGFSGSSIEPLRRYNIILNDTILKNEYFALTGERVTGVLTTQQRMVAFISAFQKQAADSVGQWGREYDGLLATQQRFGAELENFKATVGESLVGPLTDALGAMTGLIQGFGAVNDATGGFLGSITTVGAAAGLLSAVVMPRLQRQFIAMNGSAAMAAKSVTILNIALAGAAAAYALYQSVEAKRAKSQQESLTGMEKLAGATEDYILKFAVWLKAMENFDRLDASDQFKKLAESNLDAAASMVVSIQNSKKARDAYAELGLDVDTMRGIIDEAVKSQDKASDSLESAKQTLLGVAPEVERNEKAWDDFAKSLGEVEQSADDARQAIKDLLDQATAEFTGDFDPLIARQQLLIDTIELQRLLNEPLAEGETQDQRTLDTLNQMKAVRQAIADIVAADVKAQEDANGEALVGADLYAAQLASLAQLKLERPDLAAEIDAMIAEIQQKAPSIEANIKLASTETFAAEVKSAIDEAGAQSLVLDMFIDAGMAEADAKAIIDRLPSERIVEIVTDSAKTADELNLTDEQFLDLTVRALVDEAKRSIDKLTGKDYVAEIFLDPDIAKADSAIDRWIRTQEDKRVVIPVQVAGAAGTPGGNDLAGAFQPTRTTAVAGQPIVNYNTINMPSAARPQEVVAAFETWARRNGTAVVTK